MSLRDDWPARSSRVSREVDSIVSERPRPELRVVPPGALAPLSPERGRGGSSMSRRPRRALVIVSWERRFVALAVAWALVVFVGDIVEHGDALFDGFGEWAIASYAFYTAPFALAALAQVSAAPSLRAGVLAATLVPAAALTLLQDMQFAPVFVFLTAAAFSAGRSAGHQYWNLTTPERALVVAGAISVVWVAGLLLLYEGHQARGAHCWVSTTAEDGLLATREAFVHGPGDPHRLSPSAPASDSIECLPGNMRALPLAGAALLLLGTAILSAAALRPTQARNESSRI